MNAEKISDREEVLKIVNEDWPMLEELGKKRFVINKKQKTKDVQESLQALHTVLKEEEELQEEEVKITPTLVTPKEVIREVVQKVEVAPAPVQQEMIKEVKDESVVVAKEVASSSQTKTQNATTIAHSSTIENTTPVKQTKVVQKIKEEEIIEEKSIDLIKLIVAGLTHLYVTKTSKLLKPLQFVLQHKKEVSIAMMHFIVPLMMTYFMTTHVGFVSDQLLKETLFMKSVYLGIFFFGSTFVWITSQVLLSGILSMLGKSMLEVAKVGKQNK